MPDRVNEKSLGALGVKSHYYTCIYGDIYIMVQCTTPAARPINVRHCFQDASWTYLCRPTLTCSINSLTALPGTSALGSLSLFGLIRQAVISRNSLAQPDRLHAVLLAPSISVLTPILHRVFHPYVVYYRLFSSVITLVALLQSTLFYHTSHLP